MQATTAMIRTTLAIAGAAMLIPIQTVTETAGPTDRFAAIPADGLPTCTIAAGSDPPTATRPAADLPRNTITAASLPTATIAALNLPRVDWGALTTAAVPSDSIGATKPTGRAAAEAIRGVGMGCHRFDFEAIRFGEVSRLSILRRFRTHAVIRFGAR